MAPVNSRISRRGAQPVTIGNSRLMSTSANAAEYAHRGRLRFVAPAIKSTNRALTLRGAAQCQVMGRMRLARQTTFRGWSACMRQAGNAREHKRCRSIRQPRAPSSFTHKIIRRVASASSNIRPLISCIAVLTLFSVCIERDHCQRQQTAHKPASRISCFPATGR